MISIDVELAWGRVHHGIRPGSDTLFDEERRSVAAMLDLMQRYRISATWAVVGHLFLDRCEPVGGVHHPELRRAPYSWFEGDWFADDPGTTVHRDPWWYAPDLIDAIKACPVNQEIGSHSFSHQIVGDLFMTQTFSARSSRLVVTRRRRSAFNCGRSFTRGTRSIISTYSPSRVSSRIGG